jgi:hypothetical protein
MQFFIAIGLLVGLSATYLLHQFWTRSLDATDDVAATTSPSTAIEPEHLKAA